MSTRIDEQSQQSNLRNKEKTYEKSIAEQSNLYAFSSSIASAPRHGWAVNIGENIFFNVLALHTGSADDERERQRA